MSATHLIHFLSLQIKRAIHHIKRSHILIFTFVSLGSFILRFSGLSFLGLGFQPPKPELGLILSEAKNFMQLAPFYMIYPGLALFLMVFAFNFYADILRDRLDMKEGTLAQKGD